MFSERNESHGYRHLPYIRYGIERIQTFREWTFGRSSALRRAQPTDMPDDVLLPDNSNLALVINKIENEGNWPRFIQLLKRFFPRFERITTRTANGTIQFYLWETGFASPIAPTRMSDGTLRFIAILATLLTPEPPPLICIEEPELGMHPDAMAIMAELLVEASERMQIIVTTHSDALVSALTAHPGAILTCERIGAGTIVKRLDPDKLKHWLADYSLGDLWRMGELGANP